MGEHFMTKCRGCFKTLNNCRCPGPKETRWDLCEECKENNVYKSDAHGLQMKYFVLKPFSKHPGNPYAHASRVAMRAYAQAIEAVDPELARALLIWSTEEAIRSFEICSFDQRVEEGK